MTKSEQLQNHIQIIYTAKKRNPSETLKLFNFQLTYKLAIEEESKCFPLDFFNASFCFAYQIRKYFVQNKYQKILSVGCGSGVDLIPTANYVLENSSNSIPELFFTDIEVDAITTTQHNFSFYPSHKLVIQKNDLFPISNNQFDQDFVSLKIFLVSLPNYTHLESEVLLMYSEFDKNIIDSILAANNLKLIDSTCYTVETCLENQLPRDLNFTVYINLYKL